MTVPVEDDPLFPAARWQPLPRAGGAEEPLPIVRRDDAVALGASANSASADGASADGGPAGTAVIGRDGSRALVRFRHRAPAASAVALQANGWWQPSPRDACDLRPTGDGWWEAVVEVPADWRASYGFVEHEGGGDPPWWREGLKAPGAPVVPDAGTPRRHRAARGGAPRSLLSVPDDGPFTAGPVAGADPSPALPALGTAPGEPSVRWWAPRPGDAGCEDLDPRAPLPLLIVTDAEQHVEALGTPALLARGIAAGHLPPLAAVFVDSGPQRGEVLGVPGGHARWIAERLVPRLREDGLGGERSDGEGTADEERRLAVTAEAARTVVTGSSFGGLTALFAVARAPQLLGAAIAQSVSLWRYPEGALVAPLREAARHHPLRLRLQAGRFEGTMPARAQALHDALLADGADGLEVSLAVHSGGHDWAWWQPALLHELAALLR